MFKKARKELHRVLSGWVFSMVSRGVTIPADCVVDGVVTHYYTSAEELPVAASRKGGLVWVKKKARSYHERRLGPIVLNAGQGTNDLPKAGDILMGELATVESSKQQFGRQKFVAERQSYKWWMSNAAPIYYLAVMVLKGTSETEKSLRPILKLHDNCDDLWVLARIVLFNNIQCVADLMVGRGLSEGIKLQQGPVQFVQQLSLFLQDLTLLTEFQKLVPDMGVMLTETKKTPGPLDLPEALRAKTDKQTFVGRKRQATVLQEPYDPERPSYFDFSHRQPAGETAGPGPRPCSPTYALHTPSPTRPCSPAYVPASPPYLPTTPPDTYNTSYAPSSPSSFPPLCDLK